MSKRILLLEPFDMIAQLITDLLDQLDYRSDLISSSIINADDLKLYDCVFINLDQNRTEWRNYGLHLAQIASNLGIPVVMIPDHETAARTIDENGWLRLEKPFTVKNLEDVIARAVRR